VDLEFGDRLALSVLVESEILLAQVRHGPAVLLEDPDGNQLDHGSDVTAESTFLRRPVLGARASKHEDGGCDTQYPQ